MIPFIIGKALLGATTAAAPIANVAAAAATSAIAGSALAAAAAAVGTKVNESKADFAEFFKEYNEIKQKFSYNILSNIPKEAASSTFTLSEVADILGVNAETLRRKIRSGTATAINKNETGGRTGYKISFQTFLDLGKELSKSEELSNWLAFTYNHISPKYQQYIIQRDKQIASLAEKYPQTQISDVDKSVNLDHTINSKSILKDEKENKISEFAKLQRDYLKSKTEVADLRIKLIAAQIETASSNEEKLELTKELLKTQEKKIELQKELLDLLK